MNNCVKRRRGEKKDHPNQLGNKNKSLLLSNGCNAIIWTTIYEMDL